MIREESQAEPSESSQSPGQDATAVDDRVLSQTERGGEPVQEDDGVSGHRAVTFAHPSEEEFARILDFYHVQWLYEPKTFPIEWDTEGNVISAFTPDFYLPEQDLFIEITTLRQSLVTKKNRKARKLRELYPEVNLRVLYVADFRKLIEKFVASGLDPKLRFPRRNSGSTWENGVQK